MHESGSFNLTLTAVRLIQSGQVRRQCAPPAEFVMARWTRLLFSCAVLLNSDLASAEQWLALTLAPDGTWGAATGDNSNAAIGGAIARCAKRSSRPSISITGCGALLRLARNGWGVAEICGTHWHVSVEPTLDEAELSLRAWKLSLKYEYGIALPECRRVTTVGPDGEPAEYQPVLGRSTERE